MTDEIEHIRALIAEAGSVVVLTGAGVSAESGVPTFRGAEGLWRNFRAEELATPEAFGKDPKLVWEWYAWRRGLIAAVEPNPAHYALAEMEKKTGRFTLITQNVDGLHTLAGSSNVIEMHGSIWQVRCTGCAIENVEREAFETLPPVCACGALLRPGVVWFGESLDPGVVSASFGAAAEADVMLVVGTSSVVQPAASLGAEARSAGAYVVEVNIERALGGSVANATLTGPAGELLPRLL
ncbi:MAG: NAD-dependent deacylase [Proteobacteria bacterium]|nr:NAD-dependent deacylase [Pseudomonadota bacterium]